MHEKEQADRDAQAPDARRRKSKEEQSAAEEAEVRWREDRAAAADFEDQKMKREQAAAVAALEDQKMKEQEQVAKEAAKAKAAIAAIPKKKTRAQQWEEEQQKVGECRSTLNPKP
jgi:hypothetical protein